MVSILSASTRVARAARGPRKGPRTHWRRVHVHSLLLQLTKRVLLAGKPPVASACCSSWVERRVLVTVTSSSVAPTGAILVTFLSRLASESGLKGVSEVHAGSATEFSVS